MAENSGISWCKHTFNPWVGCTKVSPACDGCYAENLMVNRFSRVEWGPHAERKRTVQSTWNKVRKWQREAAAAGELWPIFCASLADVFDNQVPAEWRKDLFDLCRVCPNLIFLFLTKRPQNIIKMSEAAGGLPFNCALGATCEDQKRADINVPHLLEAKAKLDAHFAFLSCEPLLGPIDLEVAWRGESALEADCWGTCAWCIDGHPPLWNCSLGRQSDLECERGRSGLDWVITGGETDQGGHMARPSHYNWFRTLRDQCAAAGVPYHHKQNGEWGHMYDVPDEAVFARRRAHPGLIPLYESIVIHRDGKTFRLYPVGATIPNEAWADDQLENLQKVGKKHTGRLLDGIEHNAFPEVISSWA